MLNILLNVTGTTRTKKMSFPFGSAGWLFGCAGFHLKLFATGVGGVGFLCVRIFGLFYKGVCHYHQCFHL